MPRDAISTLLSCKYAKNRSRSFLSFCLFCLGWVVMFHFISCLLGVCLSLPLLAFLSSALFTAGAYRSWERGPCARCSRGRCCLFFHALLLGQVARSLLRTLRRIVVFTQCLAGLATSNDVGDDVPSVRILLQEAATIRVHVVNKHLRQIGLLVLISSVRVPLLKVLDLLSVALVPHVVIGASSASQQHIVVGDLNVLLNFREHLLAWSALALLLVAVRLFR
mmetsp:Transcript_15845/g.43750  ORF Transcript_15845/g.43750 Transcript_15845/m.43750 type:complete len:222 (+) Transcript_15845:263-928(+)